MDSKFEFWGNLPVEMRIECIKRMNFKTRMQLRGASSQDKLLVESAPKYHFNFVSFVVSDIECDYHPHGGVFDDDALIRISKAYPQCIEKNYQLAAQVIKFSTAELVGLGATDEISNEFSNFIADLSISTPSFRFKSMSTGCLEFKILEFFLKNDNELKEVDVECCCYSEQKMLGMVNFPSVINAEIVEFRDLKTAEAPYQLIKNWIEKEDLKVGKRMYFETTVFDTIDVLTERFADRKISHEMFPSPSVLMDNLNLTIISTNSPTKAIQIGPYALAPGYLLVAHIRVVEFDRNKPERDNFDLSDVASALLNI